MEFEFQATDMFTTEIPAAEQPKARRAKKSVASEPETPTLVQETIIESSIPATVRVSEERTSSALHLEGRIAGAPVYTRASNGTVAGYVHLVSSQSVRKGEEFGNVQIVSEDTTLAFWGDAVVQVFGPDRRVLEEGAADLLCRKYLRAGLSVKVVATLSSSYERPGYTTQSGEVVGPRIIRDYRSIQLMLMANPAPEMPAIRVKGNDPVMEGEIAQYFASR